MDALDRAGDIERALLATPQDQTNRHFVAAWLGWRRAGQLMPKRSAIELQDIKELLGRVILFELISEDDVRIKVAGSQLRDHVNFEATGRNFAAITPPAQWPVRRWRLKKMATRPCGGVMINRETETQSGDAVRFETVTLPVEPDGAGKPRLLMSNVAVLGAVYDPPTTDRPQIVYMPDKFRFLDIGAGISERIEP
ncbi:MAG TPA: PAS domain-containing protein [Stellaceae bacterium]|nr:PAS domain-containing protein [Stellaceae bacterium]